MESATATTSRTSRRQALARRRPRRRCVAADLPGWGTRTSLDQPRASLESTRGGSGRTPERGPTLAGKSRLRTGESHPSVSIQTQDLTSAPQESIMLSSAPKPIRYADRGTCPIPAEPTHDPLDWMSGGRERRLEFRVYAGQSGPSSIDNVQGIRKRAGCACTGES
jgi:hypothetical protein